MFNNGFGKYSICFSLCIFIYSTMSIQLAAVNLNEPPCRFYDIELFDTLDQNLGLNSLLPSRGDLELFEAIDRAFHLVMDMRLRTANSIASTVANQRDLSHLRKKICRATINMAGDEEIKFNELFDYAMEIKKSGVANCTEFAVVTVISLMATLDDPGFEIIYARGDSFNHGFAAVGKKDWPIDQWIAVDTWLQKICSIRELFNYLREAGINIRDDEEKVVPMHIVHSEQLIVRQSHNFSQLFDSKPTPMRGPYNPQQDFEENYLVPYDGDIKFDPKKEYLLMWHDRRIPIANDFIDRLTPALREEFLKNNLVI